MCPSSRRAARAPSRTCTKCSKRAERRRLPPPQCSTSPNRRRWKRSSTCATAGTRYEPEGVRGSAMTISEAERLEALWSGKFGDEYVDRNLGAYGKRRDYWTSLLAAIQPASVLEVGSNVG